MDHAGHRERLRRRYAKEGLNGFAPHEALELLLTYAIPRVDTNGLAHALIRRFGSLGAVLEASAAELQQVEGIGPSAATLLSMMVPLLRLYEQEKLRPRLSLNNYGDLAAYCRTLFLGANEEQIRHSAMGAVLSHNHPSGSASPSGEDVRITREIQHILESMGMRLYDHIVISGSRDYSFHAHHLLDSMGETPAQPLREPDDLAADRPLRVLPAREERT